MKHDETKEFALFMKGEINPPAEVESRIFSDIHGRLNPSRGLTVLKLYLFHAMGSLVTLLFCPQFGVSFTGKSLLMPLLMDIHPALCFFACGLLWMVIGQFLSYKLLSIDEHRMIGNTEWGLGFGVLLLTLLVFGCLGKVHLDEWLLAWAAGAIVMLSLFNFKLSLARRKVRLRLNSDTANFRRPTLR